MKKILVFYVSFKNGCSQLIFTVVFLCPLVCIQTAKGQDVLPPHPGVDGNQPYLHQIPAGEVIDFVNTNAIVASPVGNPPIQWGPVTLQPSVWYQFLSASGIPSSLSNQQNTLIQTLSPNFAFAVGTNWTLDYTPSWIFYSSREFRNTLDHSVSLDGKAGYENWNFGLTQSYTKTSDPQVETGTQTDQQTFITTLDANYSFNSKLTLDMELDQNFNLVDQFDSSRQWSTMEWLNYQYRPNLSVALGVGGGYVDVDTGFNSTFEQLQGRINWQATEKIGVLLHAGLEDRQFLDSGADPLLNPIYGASLRYRPFEFTQLSINADRTVSTSDYQNQYTENTSVTAGLNQRLLQKLFLSLNGGYFKTSYIDTSSGNSTARTDNYYSVNARLSCRIFKRGTIALVYQYSDNSSSQIGYAYSSSQFGFEFGYQF